MPSPFTSGGRRHERPTMSSQSSTHSANLSLSNSSVGGSDMYFDSISSSQLGFEPHRKQGSQSSQDDSSRSDSSDSDNSDLGGSSKSTGSSIPHKRKHYKYHRRLKSRKSENTTASRKKARPPQMGPDEIRLEDLLACANKALRKFMREQTVVHGLLSEPMHGPLSHLGPVGCVVRLLYRAVSRDETVASWHARREGMVLQSDDYDTGSNSIPALPDTAPKLKDDRRILAASALRATKPGAKPNHTGPTDPTDPTETDPAESLLAKAIPGPSVNADLGDDGSVWDAIAKSENIDANARHGRSLAVPVWEAIIKNYTNRATVPEPDSTVDDHPPLSPPPPAVRAWKDRSDFDTRRKTILASMTTIAESDKEYTPVRAVHTYSNVPKVAKETRPTTNMKPKASVNQSKVEQLNAELSKSDELNVSLAKLIIIARDALIEAEDDINLLQGMNEEILEENDRTKSELLDEIEFHKSRFESCQEELHHIVEWCSNLEAAIDQSEDRDLIKDCAAYYFVEGRPAERQGGEPTPPELEAYFAELHERVHGMGRRSAETTTDTSTKGGLENDIEGHDERDSHGNNNDDNNSDSGIVGDGAQGENMADWFAPLASIPASALSWRSLHSLHSLHSNLYGPGTGSARHSAKSNLRGSSAGRILLARSNSGGSTRPRRGSGNYLKRPKQLDASSRMQEIHVNHTLDPVTESVEPLTTDEPPPLAKSLTEIVQPVHNSDLSDPPASPTISNSMFPGDPKSPEYPKTLATLEALSVLDAPTIINPPASPNDTDPGKNSFKYLKSPRSSRSFRASNKATSSRSRRRASITSTSSRNSATGRISSTRGDASTLLQFVLSPSSKKAHSPRKSSLSLKKRDFPNPISPPARRTPRFEAVEPEEFPGNSDIPDLPALNPPPVAAVDAPKSPGFDNVPVVEPGVIHHLESVETINVPAPSGNICHPGSAETTETVHTSELQETPEPGGDAARGASSSARPGNTSHNDLRTHLRARREARGRRAFIGVALPSIYLPERDAKEPGVVPPFVDSAGSQDGQIDTGVIGKDASGAANKDDKNNEEINFDDETDADISVPGSVPDTPLSIVVQTVCDIVPGSVCEADLTIAVPETAPELLESLDDDFPAAPRRRHYLSQAQPMFYPGIASVAIGIIRLIIAWLWRQKTNAYLIAHWYSVIYVRSSFPSVKAALEAVMHIRPNFGQLWNSVRSGERTSSNDSTRHQLDAPDHDPPPPYSPCSSVTEHPASSAKGSIESAGNSKPGRPERYLQAPFPIEALADLVIFVLILVTLLVLKLAITERNLWVDNNANLPREYLYSYIMQYDRETDSCATNPYMFSSFYRSRYSSPPTTHSPYHICACFPTFVDPRIVLEPMGNSWLSFLDMFGDYWRLYSWW